MYSLCYITSVTEEMILMCQKVRQTKYQGGLYVTTAYGGVVEECDLLSAFVQHNVYPRIQLSRIWIIVSEDRSVCYCCVKADYSW